MHPLRMPSSLALPHGTKNLLSAVATTSLRAPRHRPVMLAVLLQAPVGPFIVAVALAAVLDAREVVSVALAVGHADLDCHGPDVRVGKR